MSIERQSPSFDKRAAIGAAATTLSYLYAPKHSVPRHFHEFAQVLYAASGTMTVFADDSIWAIPSESAVWIPPCIPHSIRMQNAVLMKSIYLRPNVVRRMPRACAVLQVSPLLRELLIQACARPTLSLRRKREAHFIAVLSDEIEASTQLPLSLTLPHDERALRVANSLLAEPATGRELEKVLHRSGAGKRTLERIFVRETGLTFGKWRQQLSLVHAVQLLGEGWKVAAVAEECGYESPSAFIAMFKKRLGTTPARYSSRRRHSGAAC